MRGRLGHFLSSFIKHATYGGNVPLLIAKAVAFLLLMAFAVKSDTKITVSAVPSVPGLFFEVTLGVLLLIVTVAVWLALTVGLTWARFQWIIVGPSLVHKDWDYFLPVRNAGFLDADVMVRLESVRRYDGSPLPGYYDPPAFELEWQGYATRPKASKGFTYHVKLFEFSLKSTTKPGEENYFIVTVNDAAGRTGSWTLDPRQENILWLEISVGARDQVTWISIVRHPSSVIDVITEISSPPFIKWPSLVGPKAATA
jgi:hypothetical protein